MTDKSQSQEKYYTLKDIIMELREEELKNRSMKKFEDLSLRDDMSIEEAYEELNDIIERSKSGDGPLGDLSIDKYKSKMDERFKEIKKFYKNEKGYNLDEFKERKNGPFKFPEKVKKHIKHDLRRGVSNLKKVERKREARFEALEKVKDYVDNQGLTELEDSEFIEKVEKAAKAQEEYRKTKMDSELSVNEQLKELDLSSALGDETSQKLDDIIGFLTITGNARQEVYTEIKLKTNELLGAIIKDTLSLPPDAGLEILLDLKEDLNSLLKKYAVKASLKDRKLPDTPNRDEIENLIDNDMRKKMTNLIKRFKED